MNIEKTKEGLKEAIALVIVEQEEIEQRLAYPPDMVDLAELLPARAEARTLRVRLEAELRDLSALPQWPPLHQEDIPW